MEYRFARKLYEILGRIHLNKYQDTAYEMIEYGKKHLGNARFSKYYFNSALRALRLMRRKYKDVKNLPESDSEIETQLMGINEVRRDQVWFTDKNTFGETMINRLSNFPNVRGNDNIGAKYLQGVFGAIPNIPDL